MAKHILVILVLLYFGVQAIPISMPDSELESADNKVFQSGGSNGFALATSTATSTSTASGQPAGILNQGGTITTFGASGTVGQNLPHNSSMSVQESLGAGCAGGQLSNVIAGQQSVSLNSTANCDSIVVSFTKNV